MPGISSPTNEFIAAMPDGIMAPVTDYWAAVTAAIEQGRLVKINSATQVEKSADNDVNVVGFADRDKTKDLTETYAVAAQVPVVYLMDGMIVKLRSAAAIAIGVRVTAGSDGRVKTYVAPAVATDQEAQTLGIALEAAAGADNDILVLIAR